MSPPKHTHCLPFIQRCVRSGCLSWQLVIQAHASWLSKKLSYIKVLRYTFGRSYRVKLQRWEYTEQHTPDKNSIWKIPIRLTSVGSLMITPIIPLYVDTYIFLAQWAYYMHKDNWDWLVWLRYKILNLEQTFKYLHTFKIGCWIQWNCSDSLGLFSFPWWQSDLTRSAYFYFGLWDFVMAY